MRAKMKSNLLELYIIEFPEILPHGTAEEDAKCLRFIASIEGKEVELVFTGPDAFEKNDNNYWLPNSMWDEITPTPS